MPPRIPVFRLRRRPPERRPTAAQRGYCTPEWQKTRQAVIARDGGICQLCGQIVLGLDRDAHIDHIIHRGDGPPEVVEAIDNLRLVHRACHSRRHAAEGFSPSPHHPAAPTP